MCGRNYKNSAINKTIQKTAHTSNILQTSTVVIEQSISKNNLSQLLFGSSA
jgi:hypothetical protein